MKAPLALIIEDDEIIAQIFSVAVSAAQFEVIVIRDGVEALEILRTADPDLIILDLHLPGVSGHVLLREIRKDNRLKDSKVIIVTADATQSEFLRVQSDEVLIKPIGFHTMREAAIRYRPVNMS